MTNKEAKEILFDMLGDSILVEPTKQNQAIIMAIKALEEQEFKITPKETEKLAKTIDTKSCSYLLPCGMCDKTDKMCNLISCII